MNVNFEEIIRAVLHPDNATRRAGEHAFNQLKVEHPAYLAGQLMHHLSTSGDELVRTSCAVLARRQVVTLYGQLDESSRRATKAALLRCVEVEPRADVRRKVCDAIGQLACAPLVEHAWPELVDLLLCDDGSASQAESLITRLSILTAVAPGLLVPLVEEDEPPTDAALAESAAAQQRIGSLLQVALQPAQPVPVRLEAMRVLEEVLVLTADARAHDEKTCAQLSRFGERVSALAPLMLASVEELLSLERGDEAHAVESLERLVNIAGSSPRFFRRQLGPLLTAMLGVASPTSGRPFAVRALALELAATLGEAAPKLVASELGGAALAERAWPVLAGMMAHGFAAVDAASWASAAARSAGPLCDEDDDEAEAEIAVAREAAHRLSAALGGEAVAASLLRQVEALVAQHGAGDGGSALHAALLLVGWSAEHCTAQLRPHLPSLVQLLELAAAHAHPRVRWAAAELLAHLSDAFPLLLADVRALGPHAVRLVLALLQDGELAVCRHAAAALAALCDAAATAEAGRPLLASSAAQLLLGLSRLLGPGVPLPAQDTAVDALCELARAAGGESLGSEATVSSLLQGLGQRVQSSQGESRAKAIKAAAALASSSLPTALSAGYALLEMLRQMLAAQPAGQEDAELVRAAHAAWAQVAATVGRDFEPQLARALLPGLLHGAALRVEVKTSELSPEEAEAAEAEDAEAEEASWCKALVQTPNGVWLRVEVSPHDVAAKSAALSVLHALAEALGVGFVEHVPAVLRVLCADEDGCTRGGGLVTYRFVPAIRRDAAYAEFELFGVVARGLRQGLLQLPYARGLFEACLQRLVGALRSEVETEVAVALAMALKELLRQGRSCAGLELGAGQQTLLLEAAKLRLRRCPAFRLLGASALASGAKAPDAKAARLAQAAAAAAAERGEEGEEADAEDEAAEEDEVSLLEMLLELEGELLRWHGLAVLPQLESMALPFFANLVLTPPRAAGGTAAHEALRNLGLCAVDDVLEFTTPAHPSAGEAAPKCPVQPLSATHPAAKYLLASLPALAAGAAGDNVAVAQSSLHGLGLAAERAGKLLSRPATAHAVAAATQWLQAPDAFTLRTAGACSAATVLLGRCLAHRARALETSALPLFLAAIGRVEEAADCACALRQLCVLGETSAEGAESLRAALAADPSLATSAFTALARGLGGTLAEEDAPLCARLGALARRIAAAVPAEALQAAASAMAPQHQQIVQAAISAAS